tara:strand:- start:5064 stop:5477 length:414 start_codon:yes stop_codon:yes gene_type:complete
MKNLFFGICLGLMFFAGIVNARDSSVAQQKPGNNAYDGLWHVTYKTLCSGDITFIAKIKNSQITGNMMSNGTSGEFEITGEVDVDGTYAVDLDGGDYIGESEGTLSILTGEGEYTPPHKSSFTGCDGTWSWRKKLNN